MILTVTKLFYRLQNATSRPSHGTTSGAGTSDAKHAARAQEGMGQVSAVESLLKFT